MKYGIEDIKNDTINVFKSANMTITMCNIIFFMIVQTLFFKYVASKQFNIVLQNKMEIITELAKNNITVNNKINEYKKSLSVANMKKNAIKENKTREEKNSKLMFKEFGPFIGTSITILAIFVGMMIYNALTSNNEWHKWKSTDTAVLTLVVFAYTTELLFYFGIVRNYNFYGDQQLYNNLYRIVKEDVVSKDTDDIYFPEYNVSQIGNIYSQ